MTDWSDFESGDRKKALADATAKLTDLGFVASPSGAWEGQLTVDGGSIAVRVEIPNDFPSNLPEIFLSDPSAAPVQSHIERSGKICIAAISGKLLDVDRPSALIEESLSRARSVLTAPHDEHETDLQLEFVSYWPDRESDIQFLSIADPTATSREIFVADIYLNGRRRIFADSEDQVKSWSNGAGATFGNIEKTFLARLSEEALPPRFDQTWTTRQFEEFLSGNMADDEHVIWKNWDHGRRPPPAILLSKPLPDDTWAVFAVRPAVLTKDQERAIQNPYSRKKPPAKKIRAALKDNPISRLAVTRADRDHLLNRTVGSAPFHDFRLAIIGCGALGSQIALAAAATGARSMLMVDKEPLGPENIYRHVLGSRAIGRPKATALAEHLAQRFPNINATGEANSIEELLNQDHDFFDEIDIAVVALGDETLERRLNRFMRDSLVRVHSWIEPLGLGGHCLVVPGGTKKGCYECLYTRDGNGELYNMAALSARGQNFQRTTGGCAGTFTPFGYADTLDAAARTIRLLVRVSNAMSTQAELASWIGDESAFLAAGYSLSARGEALLERREERRCDIAQDHCGACSTW